MKTFGLGIVTVALWLLVMVAVITLLVVAVLIRASRIVLRIAVFIARNLFVRLLV